MGFVSAVVYHYFDGLFASVELALAIIGEILEFSRPSFTPFFNLLH